MQNLTPLALSSTTQTHKITNKQRPIYPHLSYRRVCVITVRKSTILLWRANPSVAIVLLQVVSCHSRGAAPAAVGVCVRSPHEPRAVSSPPGVPVQHCCMVARFNGACSRDAVPPLSSSEPSCALSASHSHSSPLSERSLCTHIVGDTSPCFSAGVGVGKLIKSCTTISIKVRRSSFSGNLVPQAVVKQCTL